MNEFSAERMKVLSDRLDMETVVVTELLDEMESLMSNAHSDFNEHERSMLSYAKQKTHEAKLRLHASMLSLRNL